MSPDSTLSCTSGGIRVSISSSCTYAEYGDPFTIMGSATTYHNHGHMVGQMGWIAAAETQTVTATGTYVLNPLLTTPADNVKVLRVGRGNGTSFYLDFRATFGTVFDKFAAGSPAAKEVKA